MKQVKWAPLLEEYPDLRRWYDKDREIDVVLLSHAHMDHAAYLNHLEMISQYT